MSNGDEGAVGKWGSTGERHQDVVSLETTRPSSLCVC